ncbi:MAG: ketopantoate reductase family protein [Bacteroidales bacterium]
MTEEKVRIAIVGLGGVGGYLGAMLAERYSRKSDVEIYFVARGETLRRVTESGLTLKATKGTITVKPDGISDQPSELPRMDYVIYCTKSYDLRTAAANLSGFLKPETVIVPFMNGVDGTEVLREMYPEHVVMDGCVYIVGFIESPGVIIETGGLDRYCFGSDQLPEERMLQLEQIIRDANIEAIYDREIRRTVWEKFSYISPIASITSYLDKTCGAIVESPEYLQLLHQLFSEFELIALRNDIHMHEGIMSKNLHIMKKYPYDTTTSMQRDFRAHHNTEVESLTGYIVRQGQLLGVETPVYAMIYTSLKERMSQWD